MKKKDYKSIKWKSLRKKVLDRDHGKCRAIGCKNIATIAHHGKYSKEPFEEPLMWLFSLCEKCHNKFHRRIKGSSKHLWSETLKLVGEFKKSEKALQNEYKELSEQKRFKEKITVNKETNKDRSRKRKNEKNLYKGRKRKSKVNKSQKVELEYKIIGGRRYKVINLNRY